MTQKYLKSHELLAVPFDKGVGICLMKVKDYRQKMDSIINLPQFKRYKDDRSNARHPLLKEEERIQKILFDLKKEGSISEDMYWKLRPSGSQHPRLPFGSITLLIPLVIFISTYGEILYISIQYNYYYLNDFE